MKFKITNKGLYWGLIATFGLLYMLVAFVSTLHAVDFFRLSNIGSLAILLGIAYEVGQASVLFSILMTKNKEKFLPWLLMILLTALQVTANVYASFKHMSIEGGNDWTYWYTSILKIFGVTGGTTETYQVIISWISGALLPIVALGMTALVAQNIKLVTEEGALEETPLPEGTVNASDLIAEVSKVNPTESDLEEAEHILSKITPVEDENNSTREEIERIRNLMDTDPIKNGVISDNIKKVLAPGLPLDDDAGNSPREQISKVVNDNIHIEVKTPDDESEDVIKWKEENLTHRTNVPENVTKEVIPSLSEEEVRDMFENEIENKEVVAHLEEDVAQTPPEIEPEPTIVEPQVPPIPPGKIYETGKVEGRPPPEEIEETEEDRLERLRNIARENLKKK